MMKRRILLSGLSILLIIMNCDRNEKVLDPIVTTISGKVIDAKTDLPIYNVIVSTEPPTEQVATNQEGKYIIEANVNIKENYRITASKTEYYQNHTEILVEEGENKAADIALTPIGPQLEVSPTILNFGTSQTSKILTIRNIGKGELNWSIQAPSESWLSLHGNLSGVIKDQPQTVDIKVDRTNLAPGTYTSTIAVTSNGGDCSVSIIMDVPNQNAPQLSVYPVGSLEFGTTAIYKEIQIKNIGTGILNWQVSSEQNWIELNPKSGSTATETDIINVAVDRSNLNFGSYAGNVNISSNGGNLQITIILTVENNYPYKPSNPSPSNGATGVSITPTLSWSGGDPDFGDIVSYDIDFGENSAKYRIVSNLSQQSYQLGILDYNTTYYWKIASKDNHGLIILGDEWNFTTMVSSIIEWDKTFGGAGLNDGYSVQQTSDGGYIIIGLTSSHSVGFLDVWLIKTDESGNDIWNHNYGGVNNDYGQSVEQTSDGGYILLGYTNSYGAGLSDIWLIKTDALGQEIWNRTFGGKYDDWGLCVQQTADDGYMLVGWTESFGAGQKDIWLIKTDGSGNLIWSRTFGGGGDDRGSCGQQTMDGGYIMTGYTSSYGAGNNDVWLIKTNSSGNVLWSHTFGGGNDDLGLVVNQTTDGGYIITGWTWSYGVGQNDIWLIKTDAFGNELWNRTFGGVNEDYGKSIQQTFDGGYITAGDTWSYGVGAQDGWLIKIDASGNKLWSETFGGSDYDIIRCVQQTSDGGYIFTGSTYSGGGPNVWLVKVR